MNSPSSLSAFRAHVLEQGRKLYRDLPWRNTHDPYAIWVSEVMLQQTQVARVDGRWQRWLERFPSIDALATASAADVLSEWQGMGYNRRALLMLKAAQAVTAQGGTLPREQDTLQKLPGIGPATAGGICAFAYNVPAVYLETNVRTVFLHELMPHAEDVPDALLAKLAQQTCPVDAHDPNDDPRTWYYALLDYGAALKKQGHNAGRRARTYTKQSRFEGSRRQKRAELLRILLDSSPEAMSIDALICELNTREEAAGRPHVAPGLVQELLEEMATEGLCRCENALWFV